jgi:hypothetical protein
VRCASTAPHRLRPRTVRIAPPASTPALSRGLGSSLRFAPAFARGETPFRMTAFWPLVPKLQLGNALVLEALLPSAGI